MDRMLPALVAACVLAVGCSWGSSPERMVETMRQDACNGDARSYFRHVNRPTLTGNVSRRIVGSARKRSGTAPASSVQPDEVAAQRMVQRLLAEWEDDVAKGRRGHLCKMKVDGATDRYVIVRHPNGKTGRWYFTEEDGDLRLTDVQ